MNPEQRLARSYIQDKRIKVDSFKKQVRFNGQVYSVGDLVRYTDELLNIAASPLDNLRKLYKESWQHRFLTIIGFDEDDDILIMTRYKDVLTGEYNTVIALLNHLQLVTEAELLLYGGP